MKLAALTFVSTLLVTSGSNADSPKEVTALKGLDPVALVDGKEIPGDANLSVVRGRYRYQFANAQNKQTFEKSPEQYAVQIGGACAKMGPLSGLGSPDRFHVHDRKIYFFASDSCRNAFKAAPEKFMDKPDDPPQGGDADIERGKKLLQRAVEGFGGTAKVDAIHNYRAETRLAYKQQDKTVEGSNAVTIAFPGSYREDSGWDSWRGADLITPEGGLRISGKEVAPVDDSVCRYMERQLYRHPLAIVKARGEPGFKVVAASQTKIGDQEVELLRAHYKGATTTLAIDPATGRIVQAAYRGRVTTGITDIVKSYSDFRDVNGVMLPYKVEVTSDGKPVTNPAVTTESVKVNAVLDPKLFQKPQ